MLKLGTKNTYLALGILKRQAYRISAASASKVFVEAGVEQSYFRKTWYFGVGKLVICFVIHDVKGESAYFDIQITKAFSEYNRNNKPVSLPPPPKQRIDNIVKFPGRLH